MQRILTAAAVLATATFGSFQAANALSFHVGPGGVSIGEHHHRYYDEGYRSYGSACRVVVDHRVNRFGERVTVRRRICD